MSEAFRPFVERAIRGALLPGEARDAFTLMMEGKAEPAQIGGFLIAVRMRGESVEEITEAARVMREKAVRVPAPENAIDIVGTGGDGIGTLNISTAAALVVAGAGVPVAKHGNRALSSKTGAADVLGALGVNVMAGAGTVARALEKANIGFMMAPMYHPAMKHVGPSRVALGTRTIFNILGPLTNPAHVTRQLTGAWSQALLKPMAGALHRLGVRSAWLVHGGDGSDELSISAPSHVVALEPDGALCELTVAPEDAGLPRHDARQIAGGRAEENAERMRALLEGERDAWRDAVLLNAAAALLVAGVVQDLRAGAARAAESIDSGAARRALARLVAATAE